MQEPQEERGQTGRPSTGTGATNIKKRGERESERERETERADPYDKLIIRRIMDGSYVAQIFPSRKLSAPAHTIHVHIHKDINMIHTHTHTQPWFA